MHYKWFVLLKNSRSFPTFANNKYVLIALCFIILGYSSLSWSTSPLNPNEITIINWLLGLEQDQKNTNCKWLILFHPQKRNRWNNTRAAKEVVVRLIWILYYYLSRMNSGARPIWWFWYKTFAVKQKVITESVVVPNVCPLTSREHLYS